MNQQRVIILGVLFVALLGVLWFQFFRTDPALRDYELPTPETRERAAQPAERPDAATEERPAEPPAVEVDIEELIAEIQEVEFDYDAERVARNPMTPRVGPRFLTADAGDGPLDTGDPEAAALESALRAMRVSGILFDEAHPLAVVNNEVVSAGMEVVQGIRVQTIARDHVVLQVEDTAFPIYLEEL